MKFWAAERFLLFFQSSLSFYVDRFQLLLLLCRRPTVSAEADPHLTCGLGCKEIKAEVFGSCQLVFEALNDTVYMSWRGCIDSVLCKMISCVIQTDSTLFVSHFFGAWKRSCCDPSQKRRTVRCHFGVRSQLTAIASGSYITQALWGWHSQQLKRTVGAGPPIHGCSNVMVWVEEGAAAADLQLFSSSCHQQLQFRGETGRYNITINRKIKRLLLLY